MDVVRILEGMGLMVYSLSDSKYGTWINVLIPSIETVASGNQPFDN